MKKTTGLQLEFTQTAKDLPQTDFARYLQQTFDEDTAREVLKIFQQIELPAPETEQEFLKGTEGGLVFLNRYGLVIRIEYKDMKNSPSGRGADRVNDSPFVLRPLASLETGKAIFEICPGCPPSNDGMASYYLGVQLRRHGINFSDEVPCNTGIIPVRTSRFPEGLVAVTDRGAVNYMTVRIKEPLTPEEIEEATEAEEAEQKLYGPLCQSFVEAWEGRQEMRQFRELCRNYVRDGKLVAGWNTGDEEFLKKKKATNRALGYEDRLQLADKSLSSAAPAVLRSPHNRV